MILSASSAKALALVVLFGALGPAEGGKRLPLMVTSDGDYWIVKGRTSPIGRSKELMRGFHAYIAKSTAEVRDFDALDAHLKIPPAVKKILRKDGWKPPKRLVLGLSAIPGSPTPPELVLFAYNGLLGTPIVAIDYARVLMRATPHLAKAANSHLDAVLHDGVWHITESSSGTAPHEVMTLSQIDAKILSGNL